MSVLPNTSLLRSLTLSHGSDPTSSVPAPKRRSGIVPLRARSSIATFAQFVQSPVANVGELVEDWWDGSTKSDRIKRQTLEEKKQVLRLRLQEVPLDYMILPRLWRWLTSSVTGLDIHTLASTSD